MAGDESPRYTPCNGVLLNWEAKHPIIAAALKDVDDHYDPLCWGCLGPRLFGKLLNQAAEVNSSLKNVSILPAGVLYPVDYADIASLLRSRRYDIEKFMADTNSLGVHFYGKMTSEVKIEPGSSMDRILREATIFGKVSRPNVAPTCMYCLTPAMFPPPKLPFVFLERLGDSSAFCVSGQEEKNAVYESKGTMFIEAWKKPQSIRTIPENPIEFLVHVLKANNHILACHEGWSGIREMTHNIRQQMNMPIVMFDDNSLHNDKKNIYEFFFR